MGMEALEAAIAYYRSGRKKRAEPDGRIVCTCFGVTDKEIERVIRDNGLTTVEQVTNYCKAGGGCGGCKGQIEQILAQLNKDRSPTAGTQQRRPARLTNIQKIQLIQQTIDQQIRPALRAHGGDVDLLDVDGNKVIVAFRGMCAQCPTSGFTSKDVVEAKLKEFVSDDLTVEVQQTGQ